MARSGWLLALVLLVSASVAVAQSNGADQELYRLVHEICINSSAALPTSFQTSVQTVLDSLSNKAASSLYNQANASLDGSHVYGAAQCRGDLSTANCSACINQMLNSYSACSADYALGLTLISKGCYLRYDNSSDFLFPSISDPDFVVPICTTTGSNTANDAAFSANVASALAEVVADAPTSRGFFSAASKGSGGEAADALAQCDGFLSASLCADCLSAAIAKVNASCNAANSTSFDLFYGPCSLFYDHDDDSTPADAPILLPTSYDHHPSTPSPSPSLRPASSDANHHTRSHINLLFSISLLAVVPLVYDYSF